MSILKLMTDYLKFIQDLFSENEEFIISFSQFKYILENFSNRSINMHSLCEETNDAISTMLKRIEIVRSKINDQAIKTKFTKLSNLLFQSSPQQ